jgi:hypothetical protein
MTRRWVLAIVASALAGLAAVFIVVTASASSSDGPRWSWTYGSARNLIEASDGLEQLNLALARDPSGLVLRVHVGRTVVQSVAVDEADASPLRPFLVALPGGEAVVGVARSDVSRVVLTSGLHTDELPLNAANAFAATGLSAGLSVRLQALAADGTPLGALQLPLTAPGCESALGGACARSTAASTQLPRAFLRSRRSNDDLPNGRFRQVKIRVGGSAGVREERIIDSRHIASYTDGRDRKALLYLIRTPSMICHYLFWRSTAAGGCTPEAQFFAHGRLVWGSGHLLSGVADDQVAKVVVVGSLGVRHPVRLSADGGFIYDCKAYNGCACVVSKVEAFDASGGLLASNDGARCPKNATPSVASANPRGHIVVASTPTTVATANVLGNTWKLQTFRDGSGRSCVRLVMGKGAIESGCSSLSPTQPTRAALGSAGHSTHSGGAGWARMWLFARAPSSAQRLTLVRECGKDTVDFGINRTRWFLIVLTPDDLRVRGLPLELIQRSATGRVLADQHFQRHTPQGAVPRGERTCGKRTTQSSAARGYTVANRGTRVKARDNGGVFGGHRYDLFLLGTMKGRAFYRIAVAPHVSCWGDGPADAIGTLGLSSCPTLVGAYPLQFDDSLAKMRLGGAHRRVPQLTRVVGIVSDQAKSVGLQRGDGSIVAKVTPTRNLYAFEPPFPRVFLRIVALDASGKTLAPRPELGVHQTPPLNLYGPHARKVKPSTIGSVIQRGEAQGVTVAIDTKGIVVFDTRSVNRLARQGLQGNIWLACFRGTGQNGRHNHNGGITTPLKPRLAFKVIGIKPPFDGCEAGGRYGHRWHDEHGPHSALEIPLTRRGGVFFEDRATARDLAAFVRSAKTQSLRRESGRTLVAAIRKAYGSEVTQLHSSTASAAPGNVGYWTSGARTIFSERSHSGDRFYVEFADGKIVHENLRGLAFVF